jgi:hypothetical protein
MESIPAARRTAVVIACLFGCLTAAPADQGTPPPSAETGTSQAINTVQPGTPPGDWVEAPRLADLFAPAARRSAYRAFVTGRALGDVLAELESSDAVQHPPGAWQPGTFAPPDAFGDSGPYNRWTLALLYSGEPAIVARGPGNASDGHVDSWTLVSPYPDGALSRLERGTLLIVHRVPPL